MFIIRKTYKKIAICIVVISCLMMSVSLALAIRKHAEFYIEKMDYNSLTGYIYGVSGVIYFSNPGLNGGLFSYHRVGMINPFINRFVEFGWQKCNTSSQNGCLNDNDKFDMEIVYADLDGSDRMEIPYDIAKGNYRYQIEHMDVLGIPCFQVTIKNINTGVINVVRTIPAITVWQSLSFGPVANQMLAGGEVLALNFSTEEEMVGDYRVPGALWSATRSENLMWEKRNSAGDYVWANFKDPLIWNVNDPYEALYDGYTSSGGRIRTCGKTPTSDCPIPLP